MDFIHLYEIEQRNLSFASSGVERGQGGEMMGMR
jgi:hypothetical protein